MIAFQGTPLIGYAPLAVSFKDLSISRPMFWLWDFGDNCISRVQNPVHLYEEPGHYSVTLNIRNLNDSFTITKHHYIHTIGQDIIQQNTIQ